MTRSIPLAVVLCTLPACGGGRDAQPDSARDAPLDAPADVPDARPGPDRWVYFNPPDLSTGTFDFNALVNVPVDSPDTLEDAVTLVTWPERVVVPVRKERWLSPGAAHRTTELVPIEPLADRWYSIRGTFGPEVVIGPDPHPDGPGTWVSRFRLGDQLIIQWGEVTRHADSSEVNVVTSERVRHPTSDVPFAVSFDGREVACSLVNTAELSSPEGHYGFGLSCPPVDAGATVAVVGRMTIVSQWTGMPLTNPDGSEPAHVEIVAGDLLGEYVRAGPHFE